MKTIQLLSLLIISALVFPACDDEIDLTADWEDIPVVYGILNKDDDNHYIRIEKVFADPNADASEIALIPDSIYYDNLTVTLTKLSTGQKINLVRVNGDDVGIPRDEGDFANMPNYLYTFEDDDFPLDGGEELRLSIDRGENEPPIEAEAAILEEITPQGIVGTLDFKYNRDRNFRWTSGEYAEVFDAKLIIRFLENDLADSEPAVERELEWVMVRSLPRSSATSDVTSFDQVGSEFYTFLQSSLEAKSSINRTWIGMDLVIVGGGEALGQYISIAEANTGITSAQELPTYTNIPDGLGIFSSISIGVKTDLTLSSSSLDSLKNGIYTQDLNF
ncbi:MAG: hypothetical protein GYB31_06825 [Bacteroidetes bacterium]|nr:hypothetical protein [Bacteroidota bacterium]